MRLPAVAGQFYASDSKSLEEQIEQCFLHELGPGKLPERGGLEGGIAGAVVPHAGYMYSGPVAAHTYFELAKYEKPETIVVIGPNHTGRGSGVAVSKEVWKTPLGEVRVDEDAADILWKGCDVIDLDETAHEYEHSIEVQLPFLQYIYGEFQFVPLCIALQDLETGREIAEALSKIELDKALILASSDFTHYESSETAKAKDDAAIKHILALDEKGFTQTVYERNITICGYGPIATCIAAVKNRAGEGVLLKYATSGDITKDYSQVVAYAAIAFR
ncbi:MAG: AmmeMemoRadiSam system protein B [Candidatus Hydrothermarchaeales archaeon]